MSRNAVMYDVEPHIAEIYDQVETKTDDVALIRRLIGDRRRLRILEPFCGTGRILIALAQDGHVLAGLDQTRSMLARAQAKIDQLPDEVQLRITLVEADVTASDWPQGYDVVILGGNCFYEQERCIVAAAAALIPGGHVYIDNDHMEGELDQPGASPAFAEAFRAACAPTARAWRARQKRYGLMHRTGWRDFAARRPSRARTAASSNKNTSSRNIR